MEKMKVKNWHKFQHFKDRRPLWIKLHREIVDQHDVMSLSPKAFRFLILIWLLASEDDEKTGTLPDIPAIAFRLRCSESEVCALLKQIDIFLISDGYQPDALEKRREETEKEEDCNIVNNCKHVNLQELTPASVSVSASGKRKVFVKPTPDQVTEYAKSINFNLDGQYFIDKYDAKGWMIGKNKMKDWKATVRTWKKNQNIISNGTEKRWHSV